MLNYIITFLGGTAAGILIATLVVWRRLQSTELLRTEIVNLREDLAECKRRRAELRATVSVANDGLRREAGLPPLPGAPIEAELVAGPSTERRT